MTLNPVSADCISFWACVACFQLKLTTLSPQMTFVETTRILELPAVEEIGMGWYHLLLLSSANNEDY
jgi:hypothetical protein